MMGGSYISLSSGWSWSKCHLLIKMFLRFGKGGWYVVTKGRIFFCTSLFFCKADFRSVNLTSELILFYEIVRVTSSAKAFFKVVDVLIEGFSWGVSSHKSKGFALYATFSDPVRVTGREMRVLKSLSLSLPLSLPLSLSLSLCTIMILYSLQHLRLCSSILELVTRCHDHNVNVNTFCICKHMTLFWGKKNPAEKWGGKKISCRAFRREKNILPTRLLEKKIIDDQKSPSQANEVENECHVMFSCSLYDTLRFCSYLTILIHFYDLKISCCFYFWDYEL